MKKQRFDVTGMSCAACQAAIERAVGKMPGVRSAVVNLLANTLAVEYDEAVTGPAAICARVSGIGYGASPQGAARGAEAAPGEAAGRGVKERLRALCASAALSALLMAVSMCAMRGALPSPLEGARGAVAVTIVLMMLATAVLLIQRRFFVSGFKSLAAGHPNMDALVAIGSSAAYLYGVCSLFSMTFASADGDSARVTALLGNLYFDSAAMVPTLVSVGKYMESLAKSRATEAVAALAKLRPASATLLRGGREVTVPAEELAPGDILVIRAGETVPADGTVSEGSAWIDESMVTGEPVPVEKRAGDEVTGATVSQSGHILVRVTRTGADTTLSRIIALVEEATSTKAPVAKMADRAAAVFVPAVIGIALLTLAAWLLLGRELSFALTMAISVLVIACPCSLGLATPTAIMIGTGVAARLGILVKDAKALELMGRVNVLLADKTGTLTRGAPEVTDLRPASGVTEDELLAAAASLEKLSSHPLGRPVAALAQERGLPAEPLTGYRQVPGEGIAAASSRGDILAGNERLMRSAGIALPPEALQAAEADARDGKTVLWVSRGGAPLGAICLQDTLKPDASRAVEALKQAGLRVVMLTGDNERTARAIASQAGVEEVRAGLLPQDKAAIAAEYRGRGCLVAMVGDGINDAPALAAADVGIAIGAGTDVAIGSADVILSQNRLSSLADARLLSQAVIRNIRQNLFWAFFYNILGIPVAAGLLSAWGVTLNPMFAAAAMSLSSLCVVTNALRLRSFRSPFAAAAPEGPSPVQNPQGNPLPSPRRNEMNQTQSVRLSVKGMMCEHCKARVEKAIFGVPGVLAASVDLKAASAEVTGDGTLSAEALAKAVRDAGYECDPCPAPEAVTLSVKGMMCPHCQARVKKALEAVAGEGSAEVDLEKGTATVRAAGVSREALVSAVAEAGYEAS